MWLRRVTLDGGAGRAPLEMSFEQTPEGSDKANYLNIKKENKVIVSQPETAACRKQTVSQIQGHEQRWSTVLICNQEFLQDTQEDQRRRSLLQAGSRLFNLVCTTKPSGLPTAESIPPQEPLLSRPAG